MGDGRGYHTGYRIATVSYKPKSRIPKVGKHSRPAIRATIARAPQAVPRTEYKIVLPPHIRQACASIDAMILRLLLGRGDYKSIGAELALKKTGMPEKLTVEAINGLIKKIRDAKSDGHPLVVNSQDALTYLYLARKLAHLKDMIETCSIAAANEWYVQGHGVGLRANAGIQAELDRIIHPLCDAKGKFGENPKQEKAWQLFSEPVPGGKKCFVYCWTEEQKEVLRRVAKQACPSGNVVVSNHQMKESGLATGDVGRIILYNPDKNGVDKVLQGAGCEIIAIIAEGTRDVSYWNNAKKMDGRVNESLKKPGHGKQYGLFE